MVIDLNRIENKLDYLEHSILSYNISTELLLELGVLTEEIMLDRKDEIARAIENCNYDVIDNLIEKNYYLIANLEEIGEIPPEYSHYISAISNLYCGELFDYLN